MLFLILCLLCTTCVFSMQEPIYKENGRARYEEIPGPINSVVLTNGLLCIIVALLAKPMETIVSPV